MDKDDILYFKTVEEGTEYFSKDVGSPVFLISEEQFLKEKITIRRVLKLYMLNSLAYVDEKKYFVVRSII